MTSPKPDRTSLGTADSEHTSQCNRSQVGNDFRSPDELQRWADLVASADVAFPEDLSDEGKARLVEEVRCRRRSRLVQFVARAIAQDILRTPGS